MKIAFATCAEQRHGRQDDALAGDLIGAEFVVWDDPAVHWEVYDRVVIRSAWDYTSRREEFLAWSVRVGPDRLRNQPELVAWNSDKRYLGELELPTLETTLLEPGDELPLFEAEIVLKPNISAGARRTGRFTPGARHEAGRLLQEIHASGRTALMQDYLTTVDSHGETSVVMFGGEFSHALKKKAVLRSPGPAPLIASGGPAAVMLEDDLVTGHSATGAELALARAASTEVSTRFGAALYLRVDMVLGPEGAPVVMELEAIEPSLYLSTSPGAAEHFAGAIVSS